MNRPVRGSLLEILFFFMGLFDFWRTKKNTISYQYNNGNKQAVFCFMMKIGELKIVLDSAQMQEPVILIPCYAPRMGA